MGAARRAGDPDIFWIFFSLRRRIRWSHRRRACSDNKCRDRQFIVSILEITGKPASSLVFQPAAKLEGFICANSRCDFFTQSQLCAAFERPPLVRSDASHHRFKGRTDCHFSIQTCTGGQITLCHTAPHSLSNPPTMKRLLLAVSLLGAALLSGCGVVAAPCRVASAGLKMVPLVGHVAAAPTDACADIID